MEASINTRVFKTLLPVIAILIIGVQTNPLLHYSRDRDSRPDYNQAPDSNTKKEPNHYDQRQNGTENYRVKVDGLVFILAPADNLLLAGAALEPNFTSLFSENDKPKPKLEKEFMKPKDDKENVFKSGQQEDHMHIYHKPVLRISNLIAPFLNRFTSLAKTDKVNLHKNADIF